ncbi:unnamed protein product [Durusdinium trenchii]|uniref:MYND-type domain-containing protein n=1 Tax=Durusdinium trenchii TaxID=1381693 RepID=A0ABP0SHA2_9DINO
MARDQELSLDQGEVNQPCRTDRADASSRADEDRDVMVATRSSHDNLPWWHVVKFAAEIAFNNGARCTAEQLLVKCTKLNSRKGILSFIPKCVWSVVPMDTAIAAHFVPAWVFRSVFEEMIREVRTRRAVVRSTQNHISSLMGMLAVGGIETVHLARATGLLCELVREAVVSQDQLLLQDTAELMMNQAVSAWSDIFAGSSVHDGAKDVVSKRLCLESDSLKANPLAVLAKHRLVFWKENFASLGCRDANPGKGGCAAVVLLDDTNHHTTQSAPLCVLSAKVLSEQPDFFFQRQLPRPSACNQIAPQYVASSQVVIDDHQSNPSSFMVQYFSERAPIPPLADRSKLCNGLPQWLAAEPVCWMIPTRRLVVLVGPWVAGWVVAELTVLAANLGGTCVGVPLRVLILSCVALKVGDVLEPLDGRKDPPCLGLAQNDAMQQALVRGKHRWSLVWALETNEANFANQISPEPRRQREQGESSDGQEEPKIDRRLGCGGEDLRPKLLRALLDGTPQERERIAELVARGGKEAEFVQCFSHPKVRKHASKMAAGGSSAIAEFLRHIVVRTTDVLCACCSKQQTSPARFGVCSNCWTAAYCSEACHRRHWLVHMHSCMRPVGFHLTTPTLQAVQDQATKVMQSFGIMECWLMAELGSTAFELRQTSTTTVGLCLSKVRALRHESRRRLWFASPNATVELVLGAANLPSWSTADLENLVKVAVQQVLNKLRPAAPSKVEDSQHKAWIFIDLATRALISQRLEEAIAPGKLSIQTERSLHYAFSKHQMNCLGSICHGSEARSRLHTVRLAVQQALRRVLGPPLGQPA